MPQEGFLVQAHGKSANFKQIYSNLQQKYFDNIDPNFPHSTTSMLTFSSRTKNTPFTGNL